MAMIGYFDPGLAQLAHIPFEYVDRRQAERSRSSHAETQLERFFGPGVVRAEFPDALQLGVRDGQHALSEILFPVLGQDFGQMLTGSSDHPLTLSCTVELRFRYGLIGAGSGEADR